LTQPLKYSTKKNKKIKKDLGAACENGEALNGG